MPCIGQENYCARVADVGRCGLDRLRRDGCAVPRYLGRTEDGSGGRPCGRAADRCLRRSNRSLADRVNSMPRRVAAFMVTLLRGLPVGAGLAY